jgi:hypothetical protein
MSTKGGSMRTVHEGARRLNIRRSRALRALLNAWDPIGTDDPDPQHDEYDCLLWPLLRALEQDASVEQLAEVIERHLVDHVGLNPQPGPSTAFAERAKAWFATQPGRDGAP